MPKRNDKLKATFQKDVLLNTLVLMAHNGATKEELQAALDEIQSITVDEILREAKSRLIEYEKRTEAPLTLAESIRRKIAGV